MIRFRVCLAAPVLAAIVIGCSKDAEPSASVTPSKPVVSNDVKEPAAPTVKPGQPTAPPEAPSTDPGPTQKPVVSGNSTTKPGSPKSLGATWQLSSVSAAVVANNTDSMLHSLKNVRATIDYGLKNKLGAMKGTLKEEIGGPNTFSLEYLAVMEDKRRGPLPTIAQARANGNVISERVAQRVTTRKVGSTNPRPSNFVQNWPNIATREVFAGRLDGRKPFSEYVAALLDPKNGYTTKVLERQLTSKGRLIRQYQIAAMRSNAAAAVHGPSAVSLIIDADIYLPVSISASVKKLGGNEEYIFMSASWQNNVKLDPNNFKPIPSNPTKV